MAQRIYPRTGRGSEGLPVSTDLNKVIQQEKINAAIDLRKMVGEAFGDGLGRMGPTFKAMGEAITKSVQSKVEFRVAHEKLAELAAEAVLEAYDSHPRETPPYRGGDPTGPSPGGRYTGGMRNALTRRGMFIGTFQGIAFGNESILNTEAKHWVRLNYGTGGGKKLTPFTQPFKIGRGIGSVTLSPPACAAGGYLQMPPGYWRDGGFYPRRKKPMKRIPKGIGAERFFDAGVTAIAKHLPNVYQDLAKTLIDQAKTTSRSAGKHITVTPKQLGFR